MLRLILQRFCLLCPPCPSRIAATLAFFPPKATYALEGAEEGPGAPLQLQLSERAWWQPSDDEMAALSLCTARTRRGNRLACLHVRCAAAAGPRYTLLVSHGNACDLGMLGHFLGELARRLGCDVFAYDYSGYGASSGRPSEANLYADVEAAWEVLRARYGVRAEEVIVFGQSIGTAPAVHLAARGGFAGLVLHAPLSSGLRIFFPRAKKTHRFDAFANIDRIARVPSPVLLIHGTEDEVVPFSHALALFERCQRPVEPLWLEGAGHNDLGFYSQYFERLTRFVSEDLVPL